jgi:hypothetical protein
LAGLLWFLVALAASASGALEQLRPPAPQLVLVGLTGALVVAGVASPRFRAWAFSLDLRVVVALHLTRFVGAAFLVYYRRGELPFAFAVPGGWGDIAVATAAILVLASGAPSTPGRRVIYGVWNMFGLADFLFVVFTAARLAFADPDSMRALLRLPLSLLPTFLVPILIASHVLIAARLMSASRPSVDTRGGNA